MSPPVVKLGLVPDRRELPVVPYEYHMEATKGVAVVALDLLEPAVHLAQRAPPDHALLVDDRNQLALPQGLKALKGVSPEVLRDSDVLRREVEQAVQGLPVDEEGGRARRGGEDVAGPLCRRPAKLLDDHLANGLDSPRLASPGRPHDVHEQLPFARVSEVALDNDHCVLLLLHQRGEVHAPQPSLHILLNHRILLGFPQPVLDVRPVQLPPLLRYSLCPIVVGRPRFVCLMRLVSIGVLFVRGSCPKARVPAEEHGEVFILTILPPLMLFLRVVIVVARGQAGVGPDGMAP